MKAFWGVYAVSPGPSINYVQKALLQDPVTWYKIRHAGMQVTQWDNQNKVTATSKAWPFFLLCVPIPAWQFSFITMWLGPANGLSTLWLPEVIISM